MSTGWFPSCTLGHQEWPVAHFPLYRHLTQGKEILGKPQELLLCLKAPCPNELCVFHPARSASAEGSCRCPCPTSPWHREWPWWCWKPGICQRWTSLASQVEAIFSSSEWVGKIQIPRFTWGGFSPVLAEDFCCSHIFPQILLKGDGLLWVLHHSPMGGCAEQPKSFLLVYTGRGLWRQQLSVLHPEQPGCSMGSMGVRKTGKTGWQRLDTSPGVARWHHGTCLDQPQRGHRTRALLRGLKSWGQF